MAKCAQCDGVGMVCVLPKYVDKIIPSPTLEQLAAFEPDLFGAETDDEIAARLKTADDARDVFLQEIDARRAAVADSWYPCSVCHPKAFYRWAGHHHAADHDISECTECQDLLARSHGGRRRERAPAGALPDRKDVDF